MDTMQMALIIGLFFGLFIGIIIGQFVKLDLRKGGK
jgi:uncharacterized membrane-anchored protein YhcB (DUF1043 family)